MYAKVLGAGAGAGAATVAAVLPNTGGNILVDVAIAVAAGLTVWGLLSRR